MSGPGNRQSLYVELQSNVRGFRADMATAGGAVRGFGSDVDDAIRRTAKLKAGGAAVGLALAAGFVAASRETLALDTALRNIQSITKQDEASLQALGDAAVDLSKKLPQSASSLAEGLYDIASSGFAGADGLTVLNASAVAASAGMTTTAVSAKAVTAVLNAYKRPAKDAADVSDVLFSTVNLGVTTFEQLANNIGDYLGTAQALGVSFEETGSGIATMTLNGVNAAQAGTTLNAVLSKLIKPGKELAGTMSELGYESGTAMIEALGLRGSLLAISEAAGGTAEGLSANFDDINALQGVLALTNNEGEKWTEVGAKMEDSSARAGAAQDALAEQSKAVAFQLGVARNNVMAFAVGAGRSALPGVVVLLGALGRGAGEVGDALQAAGKVAGPVWSDLVDVLVDLGSVAGDVVDVLGDPALAVAGGALLLVAKAAGLVLDVASPLVSVLTIATGALADNEAASTVLAIALGVHLLGGVAAVATRIQVALVMALSNLLTGAGAAAVGMRGLTASMTAFLATPAGAVIALAALATGAGYVSNRFADAVPEVSAMTLAVAEFAETGRVTGALLESFGEDLSGLADTIDVANNTKWLSALSSSAGALDVQSARNQLEGLDATLVDLVQGGHADMAEDLFSRIQAAAGDDTHEQLGDLTQAFSGYFGSLAETAAETAVVEAETAKATSTLRGANEVLGAGYESLAAYAAALGLDEDATKSLTDEVGKLAEAFAGFVDPLGSYTGLLADKEAAEQVTAQATADATATQKDSWEDYARAVKVSIGEYLAELEGQVRAQEQWSTNMLVLSAKVSKGTLDELARMGPEGAPLVAQLVDASDAELSRLDDLYGRRGAEGATALAAQLTLAGPVLAAIAGKAGKGTAEALARELGAGRTTVAKIAAQYGVSVTGGIVPAAATAQTAVGNLRQRMEGLDGMIAEPTVRLKGLEAFGRDTRTAAGALARLATMDLTGTVKPPMGDGPGRPAGKGGAVLAKVSSIMEGLPGLRVTSTLRSPASNAAAGGSPTSYHLDRTDPAVDVAGPVSSMDRLAARARGKGGWRELLWRTAGHYDHVHFAAAGGPIQGPGTGTSDEVPAWLSDGEHVWTAREVENAGGHEAVERMRDRFRFALGGRVRTAPGRGPDKAGRSASDPNYGADSELGTGVRIGRTTAGLTDAAAVRDAVRAWQDYVRVIEQAVSRRQLTDALGLANAHRLIAKTVDQKRKAQQDYGQALQAVLAFDTQARYAADTAAAERHADALDAQAEAQARVTEEREKAAEAAADLEREVAGNRAEFEFEALSREAQVALLGTRIAAEREYTDEWVDLVRRRGDMEREAAEAADRLARDARDALDDAAKAAEDAADRVAAAARQVQAGLTLDRAIPESWANTTAQLIDNARAQVAAMEEYATLLVAARARGLGADQLSDLGVRGVGDLSQLRSLTGSPEADVARLVALLTERTGAAVKVATYDSGGWLEPGYTMAYNGTGARERVSLPGSSGGPVSVTVQVMAPVFGVDDLERTIVGAVEATMSDRRTAVLVAGER